MSIRDTLCLAIPARGALTNRVSAVPEGMVGAMPEPINPGPEPPQEPRKTPTDWTRWILAISSAVEALAILYRTLGR